jgi:hypothetical protein
MFPKVVEGYLSQKYKVRLGNPSDLCSTLVHQDSLEKLKCGGDISVSDALLFSAISQIHTPRGIFIIGNAFGLSACVLADLFPKSLIDVIDAECEGDENILGSDITRQISQTYFPNICLTIGFSPYDIPQSCRLDKYQMVFIDGQHTDEQMKKDFEGIEPFLDEDRIVIFHDVALFHMMNAWKKNLKKANSDGYKGYGLGFTQFGVCALVRGLPKVQAYLDVVAYDFENYYYRVGDPPLTLKRPRLWNKTLYQIEMAIRWRLRNLIRQCNPKKTEYKSV